MAVGRGPVIYQNSSQNSKGPPDMAAGFTQNEASKKTEQAESHSVFYDLAFEVIHGHFHVIRCESLSQANILRTGN